MAKLNVSDKRGWSRSAVTTSVGAPNATTHEGAPAHAFTDKSALFLMATASFFGEKTFYETANQRVDRFVYLARTVAVADPAWFAAFVRWLRDDAHIRTAAIVAACHGADAWSQAGIPGARPLVARVLVRADEPGEFVAYWRTHIHRALPGGVQRGLADRIRHLYTQRNVIKWDSAGNGYRFADVIELVHPQPADQAQSDLFKYLLDERHHQDGSQAGLFLLQNYRQTQQRLTENRDDMIAVAATEPSAFARAGMTWENLSSSGKMDAAAWQAIIPTMGYMALLRNLRNFDDAQISQESKELVAKKLADPDEVAASRQLPFRFLSAYRSTHGAVWQYPLEQALQHSLVNIPELPGLTVVLVDTSGSMSAALSDKSTVTYSMAGALFGVALAAAQGNAMLLGFADGNRIYHHPVRKGDSVLRVTQEFNARDGEDGWGTNIGAATHVAAGFNPARIVVVTDGQCHFGHVAATVPSTMPVYAFNLAGYAQTAIESSGTRHQLGGLSDATFGLIRTLEMAARGEWPWEVTN